MASVKKHKVDQENHQLKSDWTEEFCFILPDQPGSVRIPEMVHHQQRQNQAGKGPKPITHQSKSLKG